MPPSLCLPPQEVPATLDDYITLTEFRKRYGIKLRAWYLLRTRAIKAGIPISKRVGKQCFVSVRAFQRYLASLDPDTEIRSKAAGSGSDSDE